MVEISSFDYARLAALKQYSDLEAELCQVLRYALNTKHESAVAVFYQVSNTRARYGIISSLLKLRRGGKYLKSWERISRWLGNCDVARNQLVHWSQGESLTVKLESREPLRLSAVEQHPLLKNPSKPGQSNSPQHYEKDIWSKRDEMRVLLHIANRFALTLEKPKDWPWSDIFQKPIVDQTPVELLQRLNHAGLPAQLPPYDQTQLKAFSETKHIPPEGRLAP